MISKKRVGVYLYKIGVVIMALCLVAILLKTILLIIAVIRNDITPIVLNHYRDVMISVVIAIMGYAIVRWGDCWR